MNIQINQDVNFLSWIYRVFDLSLPFLVLMALLPLFESPDLSPNYWVVGLLGGLFLAIFGQSQGLYRTWRGDDLSSIVRLTLRSWIMAWTALVILAFLLKETEQFSRILVVIWGTLTPFVLVLTRLIFRQVLTRVRKHPNSQTKIAIIGAGKVGKQIAENLHKNPWLGYKVCGFYDDNAQLLNTLIDKIPVLGTTENIASKINAQQYHEIYLCLPLRCEHKIKQLMNELTDTSVVVKFVPDLFAFDLMHARWTEIDGIPVVSVYDTPLSSVSVKMVKRIEDIVLSSLILGLISPLMLAIALGVKLTSKGPVFYRQTRVGWNGEYFTIYKFRSMPTDTDLIQQNWGNAKTKTNTQFGKFIRTTSLDELPQFFNVLKGDMSIVGPRPERDIFVEQFRKEIPRYMQKHMVKAGITGWAQVHGWRGDSCLKKRIEYDLHYINNWSLWLDIKIIVMTIYKGFIHKNAR